jgi:hypothetical protein
MIFFPLPAAFSYVALSIMQLQLLCYRCNRAPHIPLNIVCYLERRLSLYTSTRNNVDVHFIVVFLIRYEGDETWGMWDWGDVARSIHLTLFFFVGLLLLLCWCIRSWLDQLFFSLWQTRWHFLLPSPGARSITHVNLSFEKIRENGSIVISHGLGHRSGFFLSNLILLFCLFVATHKVVAAGWKTFIDLFCCTHS